MEEREGKRKDQEVEDPQIMRKWPLTVFGGGDICLHHGDLEPSSQCAVCHVVEANMCSEKSTEEDTP